MAKRKKNHHLPVRNKYGSSSQMDVASEVPLCADQSGVSKTIETPVSQLSKDGSSTTPSSNPLLTETIPVCVGQGGISNKFETLDLALSKDGPTTPSSSLLSKDGSQHMAPLCECDSDRAKVLQDGPYHIFRKTLLIKSMPKCFDFNDIEFCSMPVWATLPGLPIDIWNAKCLSKIMSKVGKPMATDKLTQTRAQISYARVLVEVDLSKDIVEYVEIKLPNGKTRIQDIVYENLPEFCVNCTRIGHDVEGCGTHNEANNFRTTKDRNNAVNNSKAVHVRFGSLEGVAENQQLGEKGSKTTKQANVNLACDSEIPPGGIVNKGKGKKVIQLNNEFAHGNEDQTVNGETVQITKAVKFISVNNRKKRVTKVPRDPLTAKHKPKAAHTYFDSPESIKVGQMDVEIVASTSKKAESVKASLFKAANKRIGGLQLNSNLVEEEADLDTSEDDFIIVKNRRKSAQRETRPGPKFSSPVEEKFSQELNRKERREQCRYITKVLATSTEILNQLETGRDCHGL